jgi:TDG/mug DNA glycosylase family protein
MSTRTRPGRLDLEAARQRTIPDLLPEPGQPLRVLFCGINPGLYSAATGWHFARPGNRFWPALHRSGFTPRLLAPREQHLLPGYGLGLTNLAPRPTAQAAELTAAELRAGAERLAALAREHRPAFVAIVGVTAYRAAFARPRATTGPQPESLADARLWVLPNPSGLNASYQIDRLAQEFARLRAAASDEATAEQKSKSRSLFRTYGGASPRHPRQGEDPPSRLREQAGNAGIVVFPW